MENFALLTPLEPLEPRSDSILNNNAICIFILDPFGGLPNHQLKADFNYRS